MVNTDDAEMISKAIERFIYENPSADTDTVVRQVSLNTGTRQITVREILTSQYSS